MTPMRPISDAAVNLVKRFEGFSPTVYTCPAGKPTIGYGHVVTKRDGDRFQSPISEKQAHYVLMMDMTYAQQAVDRLVKVPLTQNQFDALVSFVYNVGAGAFERSTMLSLLNKRDYAKAAAEFMRWVNVNKKPVQGLINRRTAEQALFLGGASMAGRV